MPATYAHYRLGKEVWKKLPPELKEELKGQEDLFKIGLHGPDILFYYHALKKNKVNQTGYAMHDKKAREFFGPALRILRHLKEDADYSAMQAYIYGFICHYALDKECHGYVDEKMSASGVSHSEIETEFDRALMLADGFNPVSCRPTGHIHPGKRPARIISRFFPNITAKEVEKALKDMKFYLNFLVAPQRIKRNLIMGMLKLSGNYEGMHGLIVNVTPNPECVDSNKELGKRYKKAVEEAAALILEFREEEKDTARGLDVRFNRTFGADKGEE